MSASAWNLIDRMISGYKQQQNAASSPNYSYANDSTFQKFSNATYGFNSSSSSNSSSESSRSMGRVSKEMYDKNGHFYTSSILC